MTFVFRYKPRWWWPWWRKYVVIGSKLFKEIDQLTLYFPDGGIMEIPQWSKCQCRLGPDWVLATKDKMEKEAGQTIKVNTQT